MKITIALGCLLLAALGGCKTTGQQRSETTQDELIQFRSSTVSMRDNLAAALRELDQLVSKADVDPKPHYESFQNLVVSTRKSNERTRAGVKDVKRSGDDYFTRWEQELSSIASPEVKQRAEERRKELALEYQKIEEAMTRAEEKVAPLMSKLADLNTYWSHDLTPHGITTMADVARQASKDGEEAAKLLEGVLGEVDKVASALKVSTPPPPEAQPAAAPPTTEKSEGEKPQG